MGNIFTDCPWMFWRLDLQKRNHDLFSDKIFSCKNSHKIFQEILSPVWHAQIHFACTHTPAYVFLYCFQQNLEEIP